MAYAVIVTQDIRDQIRHLPGHIKALAKETLVTLRESPRPPQSKELDYHPNYYRIWLGANHRMVWLVNDEDQWLEVQYVGPKTPDLYATLGLARPDKLGGEGGT